MDRLADVALADLVDVALAGLVGEVPVAVGEVPADGIIAIRATGCMKM